MQKEEIKFIKIRNVKTPERGTEFSAGIDFFIPKDFISVRLYPGHNILIPSGIKVIIPDGYALIAHNKSGVASKKSLVHGACVCDQDYRGEILIDIHNIGRNNQILNPDDKIIQFLLVPVNYANLVEITEDEYQGYSTERGDGGFGSTDSDDKNFTIYKENML